MSFEQVWNKVLQNDMQALEEMYKGFYSDLFLYAQKLTNDSSMAEDAIQDTFLNLWQHRAKIGPIQSVKFYLIRSLRNSCLLLIKRNNKYSTLNDANAHIELIIHPSELNLKHGNEQNTTLLKKSLDDLSSRQQEIIFLKFYNNLDYDEISKILNINYQSVVNHVHKAIQKLRSSQTLKYLERT